MATHEQHTELLRRRLDEALKGAETALKELEYALLYVAALEPELPDDIQQTVHGMRGEMRGQICRIERFFERRLACRKQ